MPKVNLGGFDLFFDEQGKGVPILLGHSFLCSGQMWRHQVPVLSQKARVINMDYRGHGKSDHAGAPFCIEDLVNDAVAILDHLNIDKAIWAGLSIGGMVSMRAAIRYPQRVMGLMLFNTHASEELYFKKINYRIMGLVARCLGLGPLSPAVARAMFGRTTRAANKPLVREWQSVFAGNHAPSVHRCLHALITRKTVMPDLPGVSVPALVVTGAEDSGVDPRFSRSIAKALPDAAFLEIPRSGHLTALESPGAVNQAMLGFLEKHQFIDG